MLKLCFILIGGKICVLHAIPNSSYCDWLYAMPSKRGTLPIRSSIDRRSFDLDKR